MNIKDLIRLECRVAHDCMLVHQDDGHAIVSDSKVLKQRLFNVSSDDVTMCIKLVRILSPAIHLVSKRYLF